MKPWARAAVQGAACGLMVGFVVLIGGRLWQPQVAATQAKQSAVADVVKARRFEVVDAAGKIRALLAVGEDGRPGLVLYDAAGQLRAVLGMGEHGSPGVDLYDAAGKRRASLFVRKDGRPSLELRDGAGRARAVLGSSSMQSIKTEEVTMRPESSLVLFDKDQKLLWEAP